MGLVRDLGEPRASDHDPTLDTDSDLLTGPIPNLPRVGDVVADKYRLDRSLGDGGMGVVFGGVHLLLQTPIALKCLRPELLRD